MPETHNTFCRICEALCGLEVDVDEGRIVDIRPDAAHVGTEGFGCPKGLKQHMLYDSPDRLRHPLRRVGNGYRKATWDEAYDDIGSRVARLRRDHGPDSIAMYVGTAAGFSVLHPIFAQGFMNGLGSGSMYSSSTQDCANKFSGARHVYGFPFTQPFPDLENVRCLIIAGANPVVSKWSFLQVSNPVRRLKSVAARGGKVWVLDPRRTETARVAGEHVFIRPNTDVFFFLSFLNELIATGGVDRQRVDQYMTGYDELDALARKWSPERTEPVTGVAAATLRRMVEDFRTADGSALYCSTGVNMGTNGTLCFWLQEAINAVSGNLDRRGGTLVSRGIVDFVKFGKRSGTLMREDRSRIGGFRAVNDAFPGGILADEILTPGRDRVRALFVTGGNPLITMANAGRLREAFKNLELLVTLDIYQNETASLAHWALPCTSPFERADLPFVFPLMLGLQSRPYLQATRPVIQADGEQRDEATIYLDLCKASGVNLFASSIAQKLLEVARNRHSARHPDRQPSIPQEAILSLLLRIGRQGSFRKLLEEAHGRPLPSHDSEAFLGKRVVTDDNKVHLAPTELMEQAEKLEGDFALEQQSLSMRQENGHSLRLITKRAVTTHNSWTHNIEDFAGPGRDTNHLYMHPDDAAASGVGEGDIADVESATATVRLPVKLISELMPGTVALPHGWGHQHAIGLSVAGRTSGVNVNLLAADGPENLERVSGMAQLTGIPVSVRPAAGPRDCRSWSGITDPAEADATGPSR